MLPSSASVASGALDTAERHFHHALRVQPADRDALRGLRLVERRRAEQPKVPGATAKGEKRKS